MRLAYSGIIFIATIIAVIVGLILGMTWFYTASKSLTSEDALNIQRSNYAMITAGALALLTIASMMREKTAARQM